jgi:hypothetical protein
VPLAERERRAAADYSRGVPPPSTLDEVEANGASLDGYSLDALVDKFKDLLAAKKRLARTAPLC